ncbi:hypothetical protein [Cohnella sp. GCM10027633]|uniref:hypothetical protein n=1 Tax=unclassified Cohnella TaxID=2636738 RepID=UPI003631069E
MSIQATEARPFTVKKDVSEVYRIRIDSHRCQWANITINDSGDFNAVTDCGNFNYYWGGYGSGTFKEFLIRIFSKSAGGRGSYVYEKISDSNRDRVDCDKTVAPMKKDFITRYRELYVDARRLSRYVDNFDTRWAFNELKDKARTTWDALIDLEGQGELSQDRFFSILWEGGSFDDKFFDGDSIACLDVEMTGDRQAIAFCEVVAPLFAEILKTEIGYGGEQDA